MAPRSPASCTFVPSVDLVMCTGYLRQRAKVELERNPATLGIPLSVWNPAPALESHSPTGILNILYLAVFSRNRNHK